MSKRNNFDLVHFYAINSIISKFLNARKHIVTRNYDLALFSPNDGRDDEEVGPLPTLVFRRIQVKMPIFRIQYASQQAVSYYYWLTIVRLSTISLDDASTSRRTMPPEARSLFSVFGGI